MAGEKCVRGFADGTVCMIDDGAGGGDPTVITSPRNAAALDPLNHMDTAWFHTELQNYRLAVGPTDVSITFPNCPGKTVSFSPPLRPISIFGQVIRTDFDLLTHGLGYIPPYQVFLNGVAVSSGERVQSINDGSGYRFRAVSHYATNSKIRLASWAESTNANVPSTSLTFTVVVYKYPVKASDVVMSRDPATGRIIMGGGLFDTNEKMLRHARPAESFFDMPIGPTLAIRNGRVREVQADGTYVDEPGYSGSFAGTAAFQGAIS